MNIHKEALSIHKELSKESRVTNTQREIAQLLNDTITEKLKVGTTDKQGKLIIQSDGSKYETGSVHYSIPGDRS